MSVPQYFAQIDENNLVVEVAVVTTQFMADNPERYSGNWVETFINLPNKIYAGVGYNYDPESKDFIAPPIQTNDLG